MSILFLKCTKCMTICLIIWHSFETHIGHSKFVRKTLFTSNDWNGSDHLHNLNETNKYWIKNEKKSYAKDEHVSVPDSWKNPSELCRMFECKHFFIVFSCCTQCSQRLFRSIYLKCGNHLPFEIDFFSLKQFIALLLNAFIIIKNELSEKRWIKVTNPLKNCPYYGRNRTDWMNVNDKKRHVQMRTLIHDLFVYEHSIVCKICLL